MEIEKIIDDLINEKDLSIRRYIPDKLAKIGDWVSTKPLGELITDRQQPLIIRNEAVESLGKQGDPEALLYLEKVLKDPDDEIRRTAVWSLGQIGTPETLSLIFSMSEDPNLQVRRWVAKSAGRVRSSEIITKLIQFYKSLNLQNDEIVLTNLLRAITSQKHYLTPQSIKFWIDECYTLLELDLSVIVHQAVLLLLLACYSLGIKPDSKLIQKKYYELNTKREILRSIYFIALGYAFEYQILRDNNSIEAIKALGIARDIDYLLMCLKSETDNRRIAAILEAIYYTDYLPKLTEFINHENLDVRMQALAIHSKHKLDFSELNEVYKLKKGKYFLLKLFKNYGSQSLPIYSNVILKGDKIERQIAVSALISDEMLSLSERRVEIHKILMQVAKKDKIWHIRRDARIGIEKILKF